MKIFRGGLLATSKVRAKPLLGKNVIAQCFVTAPRDIGKSMKSMRQQEWPKDGIGLRCLSRLLSFGGRGCLLASFNENRRFRRLTLSSRSSKSSMTFPVPKRVGRCLVSFLWRGWEPPLLALLPAWRRSGVFASSGALGPELVFFDRCGMFGCATTGGDGKGMKRVLLSKSDIACRSHRRL